jgi:hypothetical protein
MNRDFVIVLDDFEFRMFHANTLATLTRLTKNDQALAGHDHLLDVMQVEPAADEWLTEGVRIAFLKGHFENLFPAAEAIESRPGHLAAQTDRLLALFSWKFGKLAPILMPPRIMGEQVANCFDAETAQLGAAGTGNPINFA